MIFGSPRRGHQPIKTDKPIPKPKNMRPSTIFTKDIHDPKCRKDDNRIIMNETNIVVNIIK